MNRTVLRTGIALVLCASAWSETYNTPDLYKWLLQHRRRLKETTQ